MADGAAAIGATWGVCLIDLGAIAGLASVMLVMMLGQTRVLYYDVARRPAAEVGRARSIRGSALPGWSTIAVGVMVAFLAAFFNISFLGELVSLGTLLAFTIVCVGRVGHAAPAARRGAALPHAVGAVCADHGHPYLAVADGSSDTPAKIGFVSWLIIGLVIYFGYSTRHSKVQHAQQETTAAAD